MVRVNRIIAVGVALVALVASVAVLLAVSGAWSPPAAWVGTPLAAQLAALGGDGGGDRVLIALLAAAGLVLALALLAFELRGRGRTTPFVVAETPDGDVTVTQTTLRDFIVFVVGQVPDVRSATVRVEEGPQGLIVACDVDANASAVLDDLGSRVRAAVKERVLEQLCLTVARVEVNARMSMTRSRRVIVK